MPPAPPSAPAVSAAVVSKMLTQTGAAMPPLKHRATKASSQPFQVSFQPGWNLFSMPFANPTTFVVSQPSAVLSCFGYDPTSQTYVSQPFTQAAFTQQPGAPANQYQGYWVFCSEPVVLSLNGDDTTQSPVETTLVSGWNLVGTPLGGDLEIPFVQFSSETLSQASAAGLLGSQIFSYSPSDSIYHSLSYTTGVLPAFGAVWVFAFQPGVLSTPIGGAGGLQVQINNSNLPANTATVAYTVVDVASGDTVFQKDVPYTGGVPAVEAIADLPAETEQLTVEALDSSNNVLLVAQNDVVVSTATVGVDSVTLGADPATGLVFANGPFSVVAGASLPTLVVAETDASGSLAIGSSDTITLSLGTNPGGGTLGGGLLTATASNGLAVFPGVTISRLGIGYSLVASASGLTSVNLAGFNVLSSAGAPNKLVFTVQPFTTVGLNSVLSPAPQVAIEDSQGTVVSTSTGSVNLAIGTNPASAMLSGTTLLNAFQGLVTFNGISLNAQGTGYTLQASSSGLSTITSSSFTVTP